MNIVIVCSDWRHPIYPHLEQWVERRASEHHITLANSVTHLDPGDMLFLISCTEIVTAEQRRNFKHTLVVHASALPQGRGWSPHIWQILEGKNVIPVTLFEATDHLDGGAIWAQSSFQLDGHELYDEINVKLFATTLELMDFALGNAVTVRPLPQREGPATYYRKRTPNDSRLDPNRTIGEQFDLMRVADPNRFPCFMDYRGKRFKVFLKKEDDHDSPE